MTRRCCKYEFNIFLLSFNNDTIKDFFVSDIPTNHMTIGIKMLIESCTIFKKFIRNYNINAFFMQICFSYSDIRK